MEQTQDAKQVESHMAVMENWLNVTKYNEEQKVLSRKAERKYNELMTRLSMPSEQVGPFSEEEEKERKKIIDDYRTYCIMDYGPFGEEIRPPKKRMDTFHYGDQPSQFMIEFIKATHHLFQIQQKRIDELEKIVTQNETTGLLDQNNQTAFSLSNWKSLGADIARC
tara:strand:- start:122 stop:619 length:498 start_codon:yes stop_codon:yes gene_type:complete